MFDTLPLAEIMTRQRKSELSSKQLSEAARLAAVQQKITRMKSGDSPRVLDLFAGCGGMSLGFQAAGCTIAAAVEFDRDAARSHGANFHPGDERHAKARDITVTPPSALAAELGIGEMRSEFDFIIGGPPCQAFARVGRSKLREVADHPEAFRHDPRSRLYIDYIDYVKACAPVAVVVENVPDMLNFGGHNIAREICEVLADIGYSCAYSLLNAAMYGVPQMRERAFIIAIHNAAAPTIRFPHPTHKYVLPPGYEGTRAVALKLLSTEDAFWTPSPDVEDNLPSAVTAKDALGDLPPIFALEALKQGKLVRGARRFDDLIDYPGSAMQSDYAKLMRGWAGKEATRGVSDHVIRYLPRDYKIFARLAPGDQYPQAYAMACQMFDEALSSARAGGVTIESGTSEWDDLRAKYVPPYDHTKFPNKWRKMESDQPARTLMAHLGKDSYSHIHYDDEQARTISVREAARLQSFPDGFVFPGTMNPAFKQIGNAVPPLLAKAVATATLQSIGALRETDGGG